MMKYLYLPILFVTAVVYTEVFTMKENTRSPSSLKKETVIEKIKRTIPKL